jgi:ABC-2 type transport system permease protein
VRSRAGVLIAVVLGAALFSTLSLIIVCLVKARERFKGVGQVLTMPTFFASNAIYPTEMMLLWLRVVAWCNPLTYEANALRALMLADSASEFGLAVDFLVLIGTTGILTIVGARSYPPQAQ